VLLVILCASNDATNVWWVAGGQRVVVLYLHAAGKQRCAKAALTFSTWCMDQRCSPHSLGMGCCAGSCIVHYGHYSKHNSTSGSKRQQMTTPPLLDLRVLFPTVLLLVCSLMLFLTQKVMKVTHQCSTCMHAHMQLPTFGQLMTAGKASTYALLLGPYFR
jgi:hypothetical protein